MAVAAAEHRQTAVTQNMHYCHLMHTLYAEAHAVGIVTGLPPHAYCVCDHRDVWIA